jgi:hypothetical protein
LKEFYSVGYVVFDDGGDSKDNDEVFDDLDEVWKKMKRKEKVHSMERFSYASGALQTRAPRRRDENSPGMSCHRKLGTPQFRRDRVPPLAISASFYTIRSKRCASGGVTRNGKHGFTG